jgi:citrate lyase subunit alpha/citrate CoA-transferase
MVQSGSLAPRIDSLSKQIAHHVVQFLLHSGINLDQASVQMGSGGISLQVTRYLRTLLQKNQWKLKCAIGGITQDWVDMLKEEQVGALMDVQSFDPVCAVSIFQNKNHHEVDANTYANPLNKFNLVNSLDVGILSALEIDLDWNVNVLTGSDGRLMGAIGGHQDVAEGAKVTIVVAPLIRKRIPILVEKVHTLVTRGDHVDVWINDWGVCLKNDDSFFHHRLKKKGVPVYSMEDLYHKAIKLVGTPQKPPKIGSSLFVEGRWGKQA